jgi:peptide/nickel transport system permease protein
VTDRPPPSSSTIGDAALDLTSVGGPPVRAAGFARLAARRFVQHRLAMAGLALLIALVAMAVFAPQIAPDDPNVIDPRSLRAPPSRVHLLGTDQLGRDVLSRLIYGSRVSLSVGFVAVAIYIVIGATLGALAGFYRGWLDNLVMRLADIVLAIPSLMIIIALAAVAGPSVRNIMIIIGVLQWPTTARLVRGQFLTLREQSFVEAARAMGAADARLIFRHVLPSALPPVIVAATFGVAAAILLESALSFLGVGVRPPTASWGNMLTEAQSLTILESAPWLWLAPGLMITIAILTFNFIGDGLRDALDPRVIIRARRRGDVQTANVA